MDRLGLDRCIGRSARFKKIFCAFGKGQHEWVDARGLPDRFHHFGYRSLTRFRGKLYLHHMPGIRLEIVSDPLPLVFGVRGNNRASMQRAREHAVAVNLGNHLHIAAHSIPKLPVSQPYFRRAQHAARTIHLTHRPGVSLAAGGAA